jgi:N6-L-threonylcarbamoyladenine synthase
MRILGIESSCDESGIAVVEDGRRVVVQALASQAALHARFGGVVPEIASRQHLLTFPTLFRETLAAGPEALQLDAIAVTYGPGLAGSLLVGLNFAKALSLAWDLPLVGVHHLEGHIYANWITDGQWDGQARGDPPFPTVALIVSGGHTDLVLIEGHGQYRMLGQTRDDAAGEAFDKVARLLGLPYPGGPPIERTALEAETPTPFPRPLIRNSMDFSFSGLKTAVLRVVEERGGAQALAPGEVANLAAGFQRTVVEALAERLAEAAVAANARAVLLSGGVAANKALREEALKRSPVPLWCPRPGLCTDNGVMIAARGHFLLEEGVTHGADLDAVPSLPMRMAS